jgi:hypothetical protein
MIIRFNAEIIYKPDTLRCCEKDGIHCTMIIYKNIFHKTVCYNRKNATLIHFFHIKMKPSDYPSKSQSFFAFSFVSADNNWKWILRRNYQSILSQRTIEIVFFVISVSRKNYWYSKIFKNIRFSAKILHKINRFLLKNLFFAILRFCHGSKQTIDGSKLFPIHQPLRQMC